MQDLTIPLNDATLNIRVAAWLIHDNCVLVQKFEKSGYLSLVGGRVKIGESSYQALKREVEEEINVQVKNAKLYAIIENFFTKSTNYHELLYVYNVEIDTLPQLSGPFLWLPLSDIHQIQPSCLTQLSQYQDHIRHIVHYDNDIK